MEKNLPDLSKFKAIAFDMDGTLIDSWPVLNYAENTLREKYGMTGLGTLHEEWEEFISNNPSAESADSYAFAQFELDKCGVTSVTAKDFNTQWKKLVGEGLVERVQPKPFALDFLAAVKQAGFKTALVTSSPREGVDALRLNKTFTGTKFHDFFDTIITKDDVERKKPDPEPYTLAMKRLGVSEDETLVFEDSYTGAMGAVNAGIKNIVIVTDSDSNHERCRLTKLSSWHIDSYQDLLDLLS